MELEKKKKEHKEKFILKSERNSDQTFKEQLFLRGVDISLDNGSTIIFEECEFHGDDWSLLFTARNKTLISFYNCKFFSNFKINGTSPEGEVRFSNNNEINYDSEELPSGTITGVFKRVDFIFAKIGEIDISNCTLERLFSDDSTIQNISLTDVNIKELFFFSTDIMDTFSFNVINSGKGTFTSGPTNRLLKKRNFINNFIITYSSTVPIDNFNFEISGLKIKKLLLSQLRFSSSNVKFSDIEFDEISKFEAINCSLDSFHFDRIDLSTTNLNFEKSVLTDCIFTNIIWPIEISYWQKGLKEKDKFFYLEQQNIFGQLRHYYKNIGNKVISSLFYKYEMEMLMVVNKLRDNLKWWQKLQNWITINFLGNFVDRFGENLVRPFVLMIGFHLLFFLLFLFEEQSHYYFAEWTNPKYLYKGAKLWLYTLNPIHKIEYAQFGAANFFMRLFSSMFLYHIIKVARKHVV